MASQSRRGGDGGRGEGAVEGGGALFTSSRDLSYERATKSSRYAACLPE